MIALTESPAPTYAAGPMQQRTAAAPRLIRMSSLAEPGTTSGDFGPGYDAATLVPAWEQTSSGSSVGSSVGSSDDAGTAIAELRRRSGLTWDQLARLFEVSRRSVHFWASGKVMAAAHEEHLQRVLAAVRRLDRGSSGTPPRGAPRRA